MYNVHIELLRVTSRPAGIIVKHKENTYLPHAYLRCRVNPSPTDVSQNVFPWTMRPVNVVSLVRCFPLKILPPPEPVHRPDQFFGQKENTVHVNLEPSRRPPLPVCNRGRPD